MIIITISQTFNNPPTLQNLFDLYENTDTIVDPATTNVAIHNLGDGTHLVEMETNQPWH